MMRTGLGIVGINSPEKIRWPIGQKMWVEVWYGHKSIAKKARK
jgi:hypothetical protein